MPIRRRFDKRRPQLPPAIAALRGGAPLGYSYAAYSELLAAYYFHDYPLSPDEARRAGELIEAWRDRAHAEEQEHRWLGRQPR